MNATRPFTGHDAGDELVVESSHQTEFGQLEWVQVGDRRLVKYEGVLLAETSTPDLEHLGPDEIARLLFRLLRDSGAPILSAEAIALADRSDFTSFKSLRFRDAIRDVWVTENDWDRFALYLRHRFLLPSFVTALPLVANRRRVLDLGGGAGHLLYALRSTAGRVDLVEKNLFLCYCAERYFRKGRGVTVCGDSELDLLVWGRRYDVVSCVDSFHYFRNRGRLLDRMRGCLAEDGRIVLSHVHRAGHRNYGAGWPVRAGEIRSKWARTYCVTVDEGRLFEALMSGTWVECRGPCGEGGPLDRSADASTLTAVISDRSSFVYDPDVVLKHHPTVGAVSAFYRRKGSGGSGGTIVRLTLPAPVAEEFPHLLSLPSGIPLDADSGECLVESPARMFAIEALPEDY